MNMHPALHPSDTGATVAKCWRGRQDGKRMCGNELNECLDVWMSACLSKTMGEKTLLNTCSAKCQACTSWRCPAIHINQHCSSCRWWVDQSTPPQYIYYNIYSFKFNIY